MRKSKDILLPKQWTLQNSVDFEKILFASASNNKIILDFSKVAFVEPFGIVFIANAIRKFRIMYPEISFELHLHENDAINYLGFVGFFSHCGFATYGQTVGYAKGSKKYIPLRIMQQCELAEQAKLMILNEYIESDFAVQLANMLTQGTSKILNKTLVFVFCELIRNVFDHSQTSSFTYCAQHWDNQRGIVEIAMMDEGIGLKESLKKNPFYNAVSKDIDAINYCIIPGISGNNWMGKPSTNGMWENSGYGLYMMSKICGEGGSFFIGSGDSGLLLENGKKIKIAINFQGTILRLRLNTNDIQAIDFREKLMKYRLEGDAIATQYLSLEQLTASNASRIISGIFM